MKFLIPFLLITNLAEGQVSHPLVYGTSLPSTCSIADVYVLTAVTPGLYICTSLDTWQNIIPPVPSGTILLTLTSCPSGYTESSALNGKMLRGTIVANGDVGTTGGNDSITPTGTNSAPTFTGDNIVSSATSGGTPAGTNSSLSFTGSAWTAPAVSWPVGVPTAANESSHTHSVTAVGTNGTVSITPLLNAIVWPVGVPTHSGTAISDHTSHTHTYTDIVNHVHVETINSATTGSTGSGFPALLDATTSGGPTSLWMSTANPTGGIATGTSAGPSITLTHTVSNQGTIAWPAGVPTTSGASTTVGAETFTGSAVTSAAGSAHTHVLSWSAGVPTIATYTPAGTINTPTFTGDVLGTHTHTITATGTNSVPAFTGASFDNRAAYTNVIFCVKD